MAKFGMAQPVRRVEDPRLLLGARPLHRRHRPGRQAPSTPSSSAAPTPPRPPSASIDTAGRENRSPASTPSTPAPTSKADGIGGIPCAIPLKNSRRLQARRRPPHPALAQGAVRHVGDPVALIIADTPPTSPRRRRSSSTVDYDAHPQRHRPRDSPWSPAQPLVWPNIPQQRRLRLGQPATRPRP